jgi:hypothetical protein
LWIKQLSDKQDEESGMRGPVNVDLVNQRSGEHKNVKVGFSWVLFFFSGILGIPLFLRRLHVWGAVFLVLWILYIFGPQILPDTAHSARSSATAESHQRFWETKFDIYLRVCKAAGILAVLRSDSDAYAIAEKDLISIYSGEFQFIASPEVSAALTAFVDHLQARSADHLGVLKSEAQKLALVCRRDTGAEFHLTSEEQQKL